MLTPDRSTRPLSRSSWLAIGICVLATTTAAGIATGSVQRTAAETQSFKIGPAPAPTPTKMLVCYQDPGRGKVCTWVNAP
jgi:hypothetical protein